MKEKTFKIYKTTAVGPTYFMRNEDYRNQGKTMTNDMHRKAFEQVVRGWTNYSERTLVRDGCYPEHYRNLAVQGAWEGWKAAIRHMREQEDRA